MTPEQQKARELVEKFYSVNGNVSEKDCGTNPYISREFAKQCALIACDEKQELITKLKNNQFKHLSFFDKAIFDGELNELESVKKSITELT